MKTSQSALLTMGRSLIRLKDRPGVYKLPTGKPFPKFGSSGRLRAAQPPAVSAGAPSSQPGLFGEPATPAAASPAQSAAGRSLQATALSVTPPSAPSFWSRLSSRASHFRANIPGLASLRGFKLRLPGLLRFGLRLRANDSRPRAQAELALEKVTVLRNDLTEADLVIVKAERPAENSQHAAAPGSQRPGNTWARASARWIKLKGPAMARDTGAPLARPGQLAEMEP